MRYQGPGREKNGQQGTQEPSIGKSRPAGSYSRSASRAVPDGQTTFTDTTRTEKAARDKRHGTGRYSRQRLFP